MVWIGLIIVLFSLLLVYTVIPTIMMRSFSLGLFKRSRARGKLALTFDDGPDPRHTPRLLDLLSRYDIKATFFVVGEFAEKHPGILRRMVSEGHAIGIHHYRHVSNWVLAPWGTRRQCQKTADIIERITGKEPKYYRPPWGLMNLFTYWFAAPFRLVLWSEILGDWKLSLGKERLQRRIERSLYDGAIIVLHDSNQTLGADDGAAGVMIKALQEVLEVHHRDFNFVTIDELECGKDA